MELLFSYGTLQQVNVQLETFGRELNGSADALMGYTVGEVRIMDPEVVRLSGKVFHPMLRYTGNSADEVAGMVFEITEQELAHADEYEVDAYVRKLGALKSGRHAWIYADASETA